MDEPRNGGMMKQRIEAMLGSQLFAICSLSDELEAANRKIAELEARLKQYEPKPKRKKKEKTDGR